MFRQQEVVEARNQQHFVAIVWPGTAHAFIKGGRITVPSTSCNTGLDMAIFEINKNFSLEAG